MADMKVIEQKVYPKQREDRVKKMMKTFSEEKNKIFFLRKNYDARDCQNKQGYNSGVENEKIS